MAVIQLDELDFAILRALQKDGRMSFTDLAKELNASVGTIRNRYHRLAEEKTLTVFGRVNPEHIGLNVYAHVQIAVRPASRIDEVAAEIAAITEVSFLAMISGDYELEVNVMCRNNQHLIEIMNRVHKIDGIFSTKTTMYLRVYKIAQPDLHLVRPLETRNWSEN
ncbi:MAG: Lrp/AsnC family transcriptional regulator [Bacteroidetes Order II. Incertae sedis bacterium]|nr:Lrp/AsnC family transcriptional regulator [Bacteroidetes Order II. bacterium]